MGQPLQSAKLRSPPCLLSQKLMFIVRSLLLSLHHLLSLLLSLHLPLSLLLSRHLLLRPDFSLHLVTRTNPSWLKKYRLFLLLHVDHIPFVVSHFSLNSLVSFHCVAQTMWLDSFQFICAAFFSDIIFSFDVYLLGMHFLNACIQFVQPASKVGGHFGCMLRRPRV